ncbi:MAG: DUF2760 domain-containing protein [Myxococcota bacterium]|nr:DUF2760 domain-containing protein [Myxococcota bacterium]
MNEPGFFLRIGLALSTFFKVLMSGRYAAQVMSIEDGPTLDAHVDGLEAMSEDAVQAETPTAAAERQKPADETSQNRKALQLVGALQREGRLVDFLMDEIDGAHDADIGAAARVIHTGCKSVLRQYLTIEPIWPGDEGTRVTVDEGFDPRRISLTGNVSGEPPFSGQLEHRGWHVTEIRLPELAATNDPSVLAPAEIEL